MSIVPAGTIAKSATPTRSESFLDMWRAQHRVGQILLPCEKCRMIHKSPPYDQRCKICNHTWLSRKPHPAQCPKPHGCGSHHWETGNATRVYNKSYPENDKRKSFKTQVGKRNTYKIDKLESDESFYRAMYERELMMKALQSIIVYMEQNQATYQEVHDKIDTVLKAMKKVTPEPVTGAPSWAELIEETARQLKQARDSYMSKLNKEPQVGYVSNKGRFVAQ